MKKIYFYIFYFFSISASTSPWIYENNIDYIAIENELRVNCGINRYFFSASPQPLESLYLKAKIQNKKNPRDECYESLNRLNNLIINNFSRNIVTFGFETGIDQLQIQERGQRYSQHENIFLSSRGVIDKFAYKIKISKDNKGYNFDGTEFSYLINKNTLIKFGAFDRWWSPSNNTSLIFSNAARPITSIGIQNYQSIPFKNSLLKFFGDYDYDFFIGKLEKDRSIPNALLFGNRFSISPNEFIDISLLRVAQFGGKGRTINSEVIKNMILGKDTTNRNLDFFEQPGNQIAGIDFIITIPKKINTSIYAQYVGEDGLDPIIDDRWIGAIFPSKRFGLIGLSFIDNTNLDAWKYTIEHVNTDTGFKNVTYNHSLYKTGYRHKGKPIGAAIDTDSHNTIFSMQRYTHNKFIKIKFEDMKINQNRSSFTQWGEESFENKQISIKISQKFKKNIQIDLILTHRDISNDFFDRNSVFLKFKQSI